MKTLAALSGLVLLTTAPAMAQGLIPREPGTTGTVITAPSNNTGNDRDVIISRGATGAGTIETNSAAGGNAGQPSRAVPQGSGGGGSSPGGGG